MLRPFLLLAAFFGFTGVALGAFAAHGLKKQLSAEYLAVFQSIAEFRVYAGCGWISFPQFRHFSFDGCRLLPGSILKLRK